MAYLGFNGFRLSISWTRIVPTGKRSDGVNEAGITYYKELLEELKKQGMEPFVTLFHWDVPQALEDEYGGFLNSRIIDDFRDYVDICFDRLGKYVKYWITFNEPYEFITFGYIDGVSPPVNLEDPGINPYIVAHNLLRAHAAAVDLYRNNYQRSQGEQIGQIGITLSRKWMKALSPDKRTDVDAAARATDFTFGWCIGHCTTLEMMKIQTGSEWIYLYASGIRDVLKSIKEKYHGPVIYITENGIGEHSSSTMDKSIHDFQRITALNDHLYYIYMAMK
ncbi:raucaffricine-O-beta-D-glucosidase-like [Telopea speciosissima]|uniref:raucaffricine-O-beta-D-glucosidase-like n=1 Tax=Telopea speciosissima TaxID=54955 RepID=UPI001CC52E14|nr:raucaffricine-O-beta-D-glucosidase-like [Telopea speciosissima]